MLDMMTQLHKHIVPTILIALVRDREATLTWVPLHSNVVPILDIGVIRLLRLLLPPAVLAAPKACAIAVYQGSVVVDTIRVCELTFN